MNKYAIVFKWSVFLGVLFDWFYAIPAVCIPNSVIAQLGGAPARMPVWPAFGAMLLVLLQLFFFSGACDINRYRANSYLAVLFRLGMALFFFGLYPCVYPAIGGCNLFLFLLQACLLASALRVGPSARP